MLVDEGVFHRRRELPRWERVGHPLDTLTIALCLGWLLIATPRSDAGIGVYVTLAIGSTLFVTKRTKVSTRSAAAPASTWLHAVLFAASTRSCSRCSAGGGGPGRHRGPARRGAARDHARVRRLPGGLLELCPRAGRSARGAARRDRQRGPAPAVSAAEGPRGEIDSEGLPPLSASSKGRAARSISNAAERRGGDQQHVVRTARRALVRRGRHADRAPARRGASPQPVDRALARRRARRPWSVPRARSRRLRRGLSRERPRRRAGHDVPTGPRRDRREPRGRAQPRRDRHASRYPIGDARCRTP